MKRKRAKGFEPKTETIYGFPVKNQGFGVTTLIPDDPEMIAQLIEMAFIVGDGDLVVNLAALWEAVHFDPEGKQGIQASPIVLSSEDIAGHSIYPSDTPNHKFVKIKKGESVGRVAGAIAYYCQLLALSFPALNSIRILQSETAEADYWLSVSVLEQESDQIAQAVRDFREQHGFKSPKLNCKFFFVDAVAAFGEIFSLETPKLGFMSMLGMATPGFKPLTWVVKNPGGIPKDFLKDNWQFWSEHYDARIVPDHPISEPMLRFIEKQDPTLLKTLEGCTTLR